MFLPRTGTRWNRWLKIGGGIIVALWIGPGCRSIKPPGLAGLLAGVPLMGQPSLAPADGTAVVPASHAAPPVAGTRPADDAELPAPRPWPADGTGSEHPIDLGVALRLAGVDNPTINLARERVQEAL